MKFTQFLAIFVGALATASAARADTVVLKNGDHLTGAVEVSDGKDVTLKTDFAGEIKIQWSAIPGRIYQVQSSTNLQVWAPLTGWLLNAKQRARRDGVPTSWRGRSGPGR